MRAASLLVLLFSVMTGTILKAQSKATPQVIASSGTHLENSNLHLDYTMGEFMVQTVGTDPKATQGFHQFIGVIFPHILEPSFEGKIKVYPNPVSGELNISINENGMYRFTLCNLLGVKIIERDFNSLTSFQLENLVPGPYTITLLKENTAIYSAVIGKN